MSEFVYYIYEFFMIGGFLATIILFFVLLFKLIMKFIFKKEVKFVRVICLFIISVVLFVIGAWNIGDTLVIIPRENSVEYIGY